MNRNRLFKVLIALTLLLAVAFTVQEAVATSAITSKTDAVRECDTLPSRLSIRSEYVPDANMWILRTEDGPTGVEGGLIDLLSGYQDCSR